MAGEIELNVNLVGFNDFMTNLGAVVPNYTADMADELWNELDDLLEVIKSEYVPIDTGDLRDSGFVTEPIIEKDGIRIEMGFSAEHALIQHENLAFKHSQGQAKYVEEPLASFLDIYIKEHDQP